jgi:hypothetical protein
MILCNEPAGRRNRRLAIATVLAVAVAGLVAEPARGAGCSAKSAPNAVALVELYTSEGCSSCPPADRWLATTFPANAAGADAIALAFHVDYWDRLGWKDRFASPAYTERQYGAMRANRMRFVYTPQVLVQGKDFPEWRSHGGEAVRAVARARPARAEIALDAQPRRGSVAVKATARVASDADRKGVALYVALADSGLVSEVGAGENAGVRLVHDHVVRTFLAGPSPDANGDIRWDVTLPVPAEAGDAPAVVAFVQNAGTGDVLQAVTLPLTAACAPLR